ncbi:MAG: zinc-ribbon domain-containing protein [Lachnospiraceae bacterium]|nr:zinc-ribbon domain-containing protein [Lachnospiraceae bacterium]
MKFCSNCGKQMNDDERFCQACGADSAAQPQQQAQPTYTYAAPAGQQPTASNNAQNPYGQPVYAAGNQTPQTKPSKLNKMLPVYAIGAVLVALLLVFFFRSVVGSGSLTMKGAVKSYSKAIEAQSGKKMLNATMSRPLIKAIIKGEDMTKKDIIEELDSVYDDSDMKIKIKDIRITDKEKMDKDDVKEFNEGIKDETGVNPHIKKVYQVEVKYKQRYKYSGEDWTDWDKKTDTVYVYKSNGNWYVFPSSIF